MESPGDEWNAFETFRETHETFSHEQPNPAAGL
jgi:hypothetical protein